MWHEQMVEMEDLVNQSARPRVQPPLLPAPRPCTRLPPSTGQREVRGLRLECDRQSGQDSWLPQAASAPRRSTLHQGSVRACRALRPGGGHCGLLAARPRPPPSAHPLSEHSHALACSSSTQTQLGTQQQPARSLQQNSGWRGPEWGPTAGLGLQTPGEPVKAEESACSRESSAPQGRLASLLCPNPLHSTLWYWPQASLHHPRSLPAGAPVSRTPPLCGPAEGCGQV